MNGDRVKCNITAGGTGALTLGTAVAGFRTAAGAGLNDNGYVNYLAEWSGGWASGIGTLSADALTLTRVIEYATHLTNAVDTAAPFENVPGSGATLALVMDARSAGLSSRAGSTNRVNSLDCYAAGGGLIGTGSANSDVVGAGSVQNNAAGSLVLGAGMAAGFKTVSIAGAVADQYGMHATQYGDGLPGYRFGFKRTTTNATPVDLFCDTGNTTLPFVEDAAWLIRVFVIGMVSNSPGQIGNIYSRELRAVAKPTGQVGSTVSTAIASDAGFTGSAALTVAGNGDVKVTVTGIAGTTINWSAHMEITPVLAS